MTSPRLQNLEDAARPDGTGPAVVFPDAGSEGQSRLAARVGDAGLRGTCSNVEPRWSSGLKRFLAIIPFPEISAASSMAMGGRRLRQARS